MHPEDLFTGYMRSSLVAHSFDLQLLGSMTNPGAFKSTPVPHQPIKHVSPREASLPCKSGRVRRMALSPGLPPDAAYAHRAFRGRHGSGHNGVQSESTFEASVLVVPVGTFSVEGPQRFILLGRWGIRAINSLLGLCRPVSESAHRRLIKLSISPISVHNMTQG